MALVCDFMESILEKMSVERAKLVGLLSMLINLCLCNIRFLFSGQPLSRHAVFGRWNESGRIHNINGYLI